MRPAPSVAEALHVAVRRLRLARPHLDDLGPFPLHRHLSQTARCRLKDRQGYGYSHHGRADNPDTTFVTDEIVDCFCLLGPADAHVDKLRHLKDLGVDQFAVYDMHDNREATIDAYGTDIIPALH